MVWNNNQFYILYKCLWYPSRLNCLFFKNSLFKQPNGSWAWPLLWAWGWTKDLLRSLHWFQHSQTFLLKWLENKAVNVSVYTVSWKQSFCFTVYKYQIHPAVGEDVRPQMYGFRKILAALEKWEVTTFQKTVECGSLAPGWVFCSRTFCQLFWR